MRPQTIQIFLPFGDPQGLRVAEITTRTIQVFDVPRTQIGEFFNLPESDQVSLYFLFGDDSESGRGQCYVGQTGSSRQRFRAHLATKPFWSRALIAVSRTNTLTDTHARFLEWKSIQIGNVCGRYALENANIGSRPHTPIPLEAECEEIFETIDTLISTLGFPLFKPLATHAPRSSDLIVHCRGRGADAKGIFSTDGLTVFKGSVCAAHSTDKATNRALKMERARLIAEGILVLENGVPVFERDTLFKTPSGAARAVIYRSANGWTEWKTPSGETLSEATGRELPPKDEGSST